jgi:hypothetical protein
VLWRFFDNDEIFATLLLVPCPIALSVLTVPLALHWPSSNVNNSCDQFYIEALDVNNNATVFCCNRMLSSYSACHPHNQRAWTNVNLTRAR